MQADDRLVRERLLGFADTLEVTAAATAPAAGPELHLVTFALDREEFGVPVGRVREVTRVSEIKIGRASCRERV